VEEAAELRKRRHSRGRQRPSGFLGVAQESIQGASGNRPDSDSHSARMPLSGGPLETRIRPSPGAAGNTVDENRLKS
jgi:hypothetical protein